MSSVADIKLPQRQNGGRPKGSPNKSTSGAREAIAKLLDSRFTTRKVGEWLEAIEADPKHGPRECLRVLTDLMEFHVPKLARTTVSGDDGAPIELVVSWQGVREPMNVTPKRTSIDEVTPGVREVIEASVVEVKHGK